MMKMLYRIKTLPQGAKASVAFLIASLATKGIAYITTPLFTRLLTADEYGKASVFFTWLALLGIVAKFCLRYGVFNNGMVDFPDRRDEYSFSMLGLSNLITTVVFLILCLLYPILDGYIGLDFKYIILMFIVFYVEPAYEFWAMRQRYELKYKALSFWTIIIALLTPVIAILCISLLNDKLAARIFGAEVALIIIYTVFYGYLAFKARFRIITHYWKAAFLFNLPLIPHYLSTYLLHNLDKLMIAFLVSNSATAYYSVAYSVAAGATIVWTAINASLVPYTYEKCKEGDFSSISRVTVPLLALFWITSIIVMLLAPEIVQVLAPKSYYEAIYVIPPIVAGVFFQVQYYVYANIVYYYRKPKYVMYASVTATVLNFVLNYIFIKLFGYIAAGYTTLFCFIIQATLDYLAMRSVINVKVYDIKQILVMSCGVLIVSLLCSITYDYFVIRYLFFVLLLTCLVAYRSLVLSVITAVKKKKR